MKNNLVSHSNSQRITFVVKICLEIVLEAHDKALDQYRSSI